MGPQVLISGLIAFITKSGRRAAFAPVTAYRAFAGLESLHWAEWVALAYALLYGWDILFLWIGPRDPLNNSVIAGTLGNLLVIWIIGGLALLLKTLCERAGAFRPLRFLNWHPGNKQLRIWMLGGRRETPLAPIFTGSASGAAKADETRLRGTAIVDGAQFGATMKQGASQDDLECLIDWGGMPVLPKLEAEHFLIEGKTGAGKTQAINEMLRKVRRRRQPAIIADPAGGYLARFGTGKDLVLNPFDDRTQNWSPFAEIEAEYDCPRIAKAAVPDGFGDSREWHFYAQTLLSETMLAMYRAKQTSLTKLLEYVMSADADELHELLAGTAADTLTHKGNEKMLSNTRAIIALYLSPWRYIPDGGTFSVRQWVRSTEATPSWLYLTYRDDQMALLRNLVSCWLELAIVEGLSLSENPNRRLWYIMDELDSLGRVSSLRAGLTKLRKYGGVCVSGLQTIAQLRSTYGRDEAQSLLSCMSNKLVLKAGDGDTAKYFENEIGQQEVERIEIGQNQSNQMSMQGASQGEGTTATKRRLTQAAVLASELMNLDNMHGYLMLTGLPLARIKLTYMAMPENVAPFRRKEDVQ